MILRIDKTLKLVFLLLSISQAIGQTLYGNEWINPNQVYFKIPVAKEGIFRLGYSQIETALQAKGIAIGSIQRQRYQVFFRGAEIAISVPGNQALPLSQGDFIEFYGRQNDGTLDSLLYRPANAQVNKYYNLFSDTSWYFLTYAFQPLVQGKRIVPEPPDNDFFLPVSNYYWNEKINLYTNAYSNGQTYPVGAGVNFSEGDLPRQSYFDQGEGWAGGLIDINTALSGRIQTISGIDHIQNAPGAPKPRLEVGLFGASNRPDHIFQIWIGPATGSLRLWKQDTTTVYKNKIIAGEIEFSDIDISSGQLVVEVRITVGAARRVRRTYDKIYYPGSVLQPGSNFRKIDLEPVVSSPFKTHLRLSGFPAQHALYDITDPFNISTVPTNLTASPGNLSVVVSAQSKKNLLLRELNTFESGVLQDAKFRTFNAAQAEYIIITHPSLRQPYNGSDQVSAYGAYRRSSAGGGYDTLIMEIEQLYDQYSYGERTPLAIFRFVRFLYQNGNPKYIFIIGKGVLTGFRKQTFFSYNANNLVPPSGNPGSDVLYVSGLGQDSLRQDLPIGRLVVTEPSGVFNYLSKVMEHESLSVSLLWRKNLLHLSGGNTNSEIQQFKNNLDSAKRVAEGPYLGASVTTKSKQSALNTSEFINISEQINTGITLATFFAHSSAAFIDIDVGDVNNPVNGYANSGKYPMFFVNGCNSGDVFGSGSWGEPWMLAANKGTIQFFAHSDLGFTGPSNLHTRLFYDSAFVSPIHFGKPTGDITRLIGNKMISSYSQGTDLFWYIQAHVHQMMLQGDPALALYPADMPDYELKAGDISINSLDGNPVSVVSDHFEVKVAVRNLAKATPDSVQVRLTRTWGVNSSRIYGPVVRPPIIKSDTIIFIVSAEGLDAAGNNRFEVFVDPFDSIPEHNENNNAAYLDFFMPFSGIKTVYPIEFSIVAAQPVNFIAQSTNPLTGNKGYLFTLDTVLSFNSPAKFDTAITTGPVFQISRNLLPNLPNGDSTVYYWKLRFDNASGGTDTIFAQSSFVHIAGSDEGWSQSRFDQFPKNTLTDLVRNELTDNFEFRSVLNTLSLRAAGSKVPSSRDSVIISFNGVRLVHNTLDVCTPNGIYMMAFNKNTGQPYPVLPESLADFANGLCGLSPAVVNNFDSTHIHQFLYPQRFIDSVRAGEKVLIVSAGRGYYQSWPLAIKNAFQQIGLSLTTINSLQNGWPFIAVGEKNGLPGSAMVVLPDTGVFVSVPADSQMIIFNIPIVGRVDSGFMNSTTIGPATDWGTYYQQFVLPDTSDRLDVAIVGIDTLGTETVLSSNIISDSLSLGFISAAAYPYIRLRAHFKDQFNINPPALRKWQVIYRGVPEGIVEPASSGNNNYQVADKQEGEDFMLDFVFKNISNRDFDKDLVVLSEINNKTSRTISTQYDTLTVLPSGNSITFTREVKTLGLGGINELKIYFNPRSQAEQYYDNNIFVVSFNVLVDKKHPTLEVAFDGQRIMDGDIVSAKPGIEILFKDENKFLLKQDTTGIDIFLRRPCAGCQFERVILGSPYVQLYPASNNNQFRIEYNPPGLQDGIHTLRVQGDDVSGNLSGTGPYQVNFEVITEAAITNFVPYPNPFSTSTRFIFTLTGSEVPDQIMIRIMTVTGRVVREITHHELGPIRIGNNKTEYAWDGRDQFGDQLANGVYLYKVIARIKGQEIKQRDTSADKFFKKDIGKMYILR